MLFHKIVVSQCVSHIKPNNTNNASIVLFIWLVSRGWDYHHNTTKLLLKWTDRGDSSLTASETQQKLPLNWQLKAAGLFLGYSLKCEDPLPHRVIAEHLCYYLYINHWIGYPELIFIILKILTENQEWFFFLNLMLLDICWLATLDYFFHCLARFFLMSTLHNMLRVGT